MLFDGLQKFGRNYQKISEFIGSKDRDQVNKHIIYLRTKIKNNPNANEADHFEKHDVEIRKHWTEEEEIMLFEGLQKFGKDY